MKIQVQPIYELTCRATHALIQQFGIVGTIRFLNQLRAGSGNYTEERENMFRDKSVKDIIAEIKFQRAKVN